VVNHDIKTWDDAVKLATEAGPDWIPTETEGWSPRFGVTQPPKVGDKVSYAFNGDYYPDGEVVSVGTGPRMTVTTSSGRRYNRFRKTGTWRSSGGGTWSLVQGHHDQRNPHF
jgi:hypothetical protein